LLKRRLIISNNADRDLEYINYFPAINIVTLVELKSNLLAAKDL